MKTEEYNREHDHVDITEPENALAPVSLDQVSKVIKDAVARAGWTELSPVQSRAIPYIQAKRDLMVQARTGSGKTGAFILPILERVDLRQNNCQVLVLVPTRELARQVEADAKLLVGSSGIRTIPVYGGTGYKPQIDAFKKGAHIVVGTPGRVLDHLIKRNLTLKNLKMLIFDEADRMMSMGFYPDMVRLQDFLPRKDISGYMFSATIPVHVKALAHQFLSSPGFLSLSQDRIYVEDTEHVYYLTPGMDKDRSLVRIIEIETPQQAIIFCNTKAKVGYVAEVLQRFGYNADEISSDLSQNKRDKVLRRVRDGDLRFLVATDVAARGIDIPNLSHVFQYEPPEDIETYIHRAGRTGRAGANGTAVMLIAHSEERQLRSIGRHYKIEFTQRPLPQDEDVRTLVAQRLVGQLEARLRDRDRLQIERMRRFLPLASQLSENEDGLDLLTMLLDDAYHVWMHNPPELPSMDRKQPIKNSGRRKRKPPHRRSRNHRR
ncbi:MAG: DEAD/DEAH box helicase [Anaerolineae bacterium]|nr:DEAD/DEAH box helicase [Anaerolineae bacterium]